MGFVYRFLFCLALFVLALVHSGQATQAVLTVTPSSLPNATTGTAYSQSFSTVGGASPYTYSVSAGTLPAGFNLANNGVLSGTSTAAGLYNFTIASEDINKCLGTVAISLRVCPPLSLISLPSTLPQAGLGNPYYGVISASGGTAPYTCTLLSGTLLSGLSLSSSGIISGIPSAEGGGWITIRATDANGCRGQQSFLISTCSSNPLVAVPCYVQGDVAASDVLVAFPYSYSADRDGDINGTTNGAASQTRPDPSLHLASNAQIGCVYGLGWKQSTKELFMGAYLRRKTAFGPNGTGAIYRIVNPAAGGTPSLYVNLNSVFTGTPAGINPHPAGTDYTNDSASVQYVGKRGLGDLDVSPNGNTLYAVCLGDRRLYAIPTTGALNSTTIQRFAIPTSISGCAASDVRPFALGFDKTGQLFVGGVCTAESTQNASELRALVWRFDNPGFTLVMNTSLSYNLISWYQTGPWNSDDSLWAGNPGAQLMLTDLVFDGNDLVLGFRDRFGDITPSAGRSPFEDPWPRGHGAILRASASGGNFVLESNGTAGTRTTAGANNGKGPGGGIFYYQQISGDTDLLQTSMGGLLQLPGSNEVVTTAYDPVAFDSNGVELDNNYNSNGIVRHNNLTGVQTGTYEVFTASQAPVLNTFGKTNGLGDIEAICEPPRPLAIGNLVWSDDGAGGGNANNGLKDGTEAGINGVSLVLDYDANGDGDFADQGEAEFAAQSTSNGGQYLFTGLVAGRYRVRIPTLPSTHPLLSSVRVATDNGVDNDNNGSPSGAQAVSPTITLAIGSEPGSAGSGDSDTTIDFALRPCPTILVNPATLPMGTVGSSYSTSLAASGGVGPYTFSTISGSWPAGLSLSSNGLISGTPTAVGLVSLTVQATDSEGCSGTQVISVRICPILSLASNSLPAGSVGSSYSQSLVASGGTAPYSFSLESGVLPTGLSLASSGIVSGTPTAQENAVFTVLITDANGCVGSASVTLNVSCPPITINPNSLPTAIVGTAYSQTFTATGGTGPYTWSVLSGGLPAGLTLSSAGELSGTPTSASASSFTVKAVDTYNCSGSAPVSLRICPILNVPNSLPFATVGLPYIQQLVASNGTAPYSWSIVSGSLPAGLSMAGDGTISGTPSVVSAPTVGFNVIDADGCTRSTLIVLRICPVLTITTATLPVGTVGTAYSQLLSVTGGTAPYNWSITAGTMPAGLSLSASGQIDGTPTTVEASGLTFLVTDANGCAGSSTLTLRICPSISISPASLPAAVVGESYSQVMSASGGNGPYSWSVILGSLPSGVSLSSAGVLSGVPTTAISTNITLRATDQDGCSGSRAYLFTASCPPIAITPSAPPMPTVGVSYTQTFTATGGTAPYVWLVTAGALPNGLNLSPGGVLSGIPTAAGLANFTLSAVDANNCTAAQSISLRVCPVITLQPSTLVDCTVGVPYSATLAASNGTDPYIWNVASGSLPPGTSLSTAGTLSGTPTTPGTFSFTLRATDANGCPGLQAYSVKICPQIVISTSPAVIPGATIGNSYSLTLLGNGGTSPYSFAVTDGSLPSGLNLSNAGVISGTPTATGTGNFTVTVTDAAGCQGAAAFSLPVNCPSITLSLSSSTSLMVGTSGSLTFSASGGSGSYTFALASGSLPPGLTLNSAGVVSGTPTAAGNYSFAIRATDSNSCAGTANVTSPVSSPLCLGNLAFQDVNGNGLQDDSTGTVIAGVAVSLFYSDGVTPALDALGVLIESTMTSAGGTYQFCNLAPGDYVVRAAIPSGYTVPPASSDPDDNNNTNNDGSRVAGQSYVQSGVITLSYGAETGDGDNNPNTNPSVDFGFAPAMRLGNIVFQDDNGNGKYDASTDSFISGVTMALVHAGTLQVIDTKVTDPTGRYLFTNVLPGSYYVQIPASQFAQGGPLYGKFSSTGSSVSDDHLGEDGIDAPSPEETGVSSALILLAAGTEPTDASGVEVGIGSTIDNTGDANGDMTIDFGFVTPVCLGNYVYVDPSASGTQSGSSALAGATVSLYRGDGSTPASDAAGNLVTPLVTDATGLYQFCQLSPGSYVVRVTPPSGYVPAPGGSSPDNDNNSDSNGLAVSGQLYVQSQPITLETGAEPINDGDAIANTNLTLDFGFVPLKTPSWAAWQYSHQALGATGPTDNPDGDQYPNMLEFAHCLPPDTAVNPTCPFEIRTNQTTGRVDACARRTVGLQGVTFTLQTAPPFVGQGPAVWTTLNAVPVIEAGSDGIEWVCWNDLEVLTSLTNGGFARLVASLDVDGNNTPEASHTSSPVGWLKTTIQTQCESYAPGFVKCDLFQGNVTAGTNVLSFPASAGATQLSSVLNLSKAYYLEVVSGAYEGHRFDVNVSGTTGGILALDAASTRNTLSPIPTLTGSTIVVREHMTLAEFFPPSLFLASNHQTVSDNVFFYRNNRWETYFLNSSNYFGRRWIIVGDSTRSDKGGMVIAPEVGVLVHRRGAPITKVTSGFVRTNDFAIPVNSGQSLIAGGWPLTQSPVDRGMTLSNGFTGGRAVVTADNIMVWRGDSTPGSLGYHSYFLLSTQTRQFWAKSGVSTLTNLDASPLFIRGRASFVKLLNSNPQWRIQHPQF